MIGKIILFKPKVILTTPFTNESTRREVRWLLILFALSERILGYKSPNFSIG